MKKKLYIDCCDRCEKPKVDITCYVCKRKICFACSASIHYEYHINICYDCRNREDFKQIYKKYEKKYWDTHSKLKKLLLALPKKLNPNPPQRKRGRDEA